MIDIERLEGEIVDSLRPLEPEKIILFGSYAYGEQTEESDVDLLILKKLEIAKMQDYVLQTRKKIRPLIFREKIGFDILSRVLNNWKSEFGKSGIGFTSRSRRKAR